MLNKIKSKTTSLPLYLNVQVKHDFPLASQFPNTNFLCSQAGHRCNDSLSSTHRTLNADAKSLKADVCVKSRLGLSENIEQSFREGQEETLGVEAENQMGQNLSFHPTSLGRAV